MISTRFATCILGSLSCCLLNLAEATSSNVFPRQENGLESFISAQSPIALKGVLNNIGADGALAKGALPGIVVASPSTEDPNYFYTWTRDSALTLKLLVDAYINGNNGLGSLIQEYILSQGNVQTVDNLSGQLESGRGLGEPKYYTNITAFNGEWGRPQRDGPALRATAIMAYAKAVLDASSDNAAAVRDVIWPIVSNDLNYVGQYWNQTGFDLWEEVNGSSFFTTAVQYRALIEGADFAESIGKGCDGCASQAPNILCFMQDFWNGSAIISNINLKDDQRTGLDCNSILTSIHMYDPESGCTDTTFQPCSSRALSNHKAVVDSFRGDLYTINSGLGPGKAAAVGRYAKDVYYEGNPWYICTFAAAEQLYRALNQWNSAGSITVDDVNTRFFSDLDVTTSNGKYATDSPEYDKISSAVRSYADGFVAVAQKYTPEDGSLAEQFSRENGTAVSARDLTWSYASFLTMEQARNSTQPQSWGESNANTLPDSCKASSADGTYVRPTATSFPAIAGNPSEGGSGGGKGSAARASETSVAAANRATAFLRW